MDGMALFLQSVSQAQGVGFNAAKKTRKKAV
jgi:hypothetical protein